MSKPGKKLLMKDFKKVFVETYNEVFGELDSKKFKRFRKFKGSKNA